MVFEQLVRLRDVSRSWARLEDFAQRFSTHDPTPEELAEWAESLES